MFLAESTAHKPFHNQVLTKLSHESRVFVTVLNHFLSVLPVEVRILPEDHVEVDDEPLVLLVLPPVADVVVVVPDDVVEPLVEVLLVPVVVVPVVEELVPVLDVVDDDVQEVVELGELTMLLSCCQKPDQNDEIHPESARPESSGRTILISGRFERLATISSICR